MSLPQCCSSHAHRSPPSHAHGPQLKKWTPALRPSACTSRSPKATMRGRTHGRQGAMAVDRPKAERPKARRPVKRRGRRPSGRRWACEGASSNGFLDDGGNLLCSPPLCSLLGRIYSAPLLLLVPLPQDPVRQTWSRDVRQSPAAAAAGQGADGRCDRDSMACVVSPVFTSFPRNTCHCRTRA